ncbi:hypothetical protein MUK42_34778 [Musa troglodytarum]|uniref:Uncharacterized protein n=1 Tax=Musa troglodytarum TaxID=320322 RepID=A0A9E7K8F8_9LILI|nr:hypothetical protein MUK42_34778 [Musa troglodytarum]
MDMELEPRTKALAYKIKATSRESPAQKAANVFDPDLRTHWSTGTNTKEWILLELDEPCLLSHIRIYNKSVLEWEISVGLRFKPEAFLKVRPRCEAPRREMVYPMNYTPCRYVRISCLRGNPIAIFFIQLMGVTVTGLEPELQPIANYLIPHIISHKQDAHDMHLQLLQDVAKNLLVFLPQLETDLTNFPDAAEINIRFFAMLAGPFYPILRLSNERKASSVLPFSSDLDASKSNPSSTLTVSSNFEAQPRRSRSPPFAELASSSIAFRSDAVIILLRKAYKESHLGIVCRRASIALHRLVEANNLLGESACTDDLGLSSISDEIVKAEVASHMQPADYSSLFGEEFKLPEDYWDASYLNVLDISAVEEGILHVLFGCASQPLLCCKLADSNSNFWSLLPLIQALLPALRPPISLSDQVDDSFSQWKHPSVQHALSQAKAACVLIDLCSGPLSPWISTITAKVDLAIELLEDLLGVIQGVPQSAGRARAALKYILLALSGHMDDVLSKYKEFKHRLLFLLEMLEPFLDPVITGTKITTSEDASDIHLEKQKNCSIALNVIRIALRRPAILPSVESEWRRGSVAPSVLLSVLGPHMSLPSDIDLCKCSFPKVADQDSLAVSDSVICSHGASSISSSPDEAKGKIDASEAATRKDVLQDANLQFAPRDLSKIVLTSVPNYFTGDCISLNSGCGVSEVNKISNNNFQLDAGFFADYFYSQADYLQLVNHQDSVFRASEFERLAADLCSQHDITPESHEAAIDALLLAAECYVNPFFMISYGCNSELMNQMKIIGSKFKNKNGLVEFNKDLKRCNVNLETIAYLESKRDITVLQILLRAAKLDLESERILALGKPYTYYFEGNQQALEISQVDIESADVVTLVRQNQSLLCHFVTRQLRREQQSSHEILLQSLLFLLHSATELSCSAEDVIDIILQSAENLSGQLTSLYTQLKAGNIQLEMEKLHGLRRRWALLERLVVASSGNDEGTNPIGIKSAGFIYRTLVPPSSWMQKISRFSSCTCPLSRFLGWMAVSRYAKQYLKEHLFIASDLSQISSLLSIFADELALTDNLVRKKIESAYSDPSGTKTHSQVDKEFESSNQSDAKLSFQVLFPHLHMFFPNMRKQFGEFGEIILEAVGMQLKSLPCSAVPDILCWFADLCLWPYLETIRNHLHVTKNANPLRGHIARNAKAVIFYVLESITVEHMEALVNEMPRVAHILISLCRASYCDVSVDEKHLSDASLHQDFHLSNFEELFDSIRCEKELNEVTEEKKFQGSLMICIFGHLFPDLSFRRKKEVLESLLLWVDFTTSAPISSIYDYLSAFQKLINSCLIVVAQGLKSFGVNLPLERKQSTAGGPNLSINDGLIHQFDSPDLADGYVNRLSKTCESDDTCTGLLGEGLHILSAGEIEELLDRLGKLISGLLPAIEASWKMHYKLGMRLTCTLANCLFFSRCLSVVIQASTGDGDGQDTHQSDSSDLPSRYWVNALEGLMGAISSSQKNHCWQVASAMLDFLFKLPENITFSSVVSSLCSMILIFCCNAPKISWRLHTDKWLSLLFERGIDNLSGNEASLVDLFCTMLGHSEPEQRAVALRHLGRIVDLGSYNGVNELPYSVKQNLVCSRLVGTVPESVASILVTKTWDRVMVVASSDPSMLLRTHAMVLLLAFVPYAERAQLQSFLVATHTILRGMGKVTNSMEVGHLTRLSLHILASACLYSPVEDITLIPESVWRNLEQMGISKTGVLNDLEKNLCLSLCKLINEFDGAKPVLKELLSSSLMGKPSDPNFQGIRETILQVLSSLTSIQSYFEFFSERIDQQSQELEEAEIEMELLREEAAFEEASGFLLEEAVPSLTISSDKEINRLQQIKDEIRSLEKSKLREEIVARRQKKLLMRHARKKCLEEAALREMELLQELDRERTSELEHDIERQRELENERARTRELQFNLDMEKERQIQKELQRELEQVESGTRSFRREFSSNPSNRSRERYRDRDNGRSGQEANLRSSSRGHDGGAPQMTTTIATGSSVGPTVVLAGSRSFSGQLPTILQSRERADERTSNYEDAIEGSRDSGDASSIGDSESGSAFDGLPGAFGTVPRHGSRGSKSRQIVERRERDGRREGKWERKHS